MEKTTVASKFRPNKKVRARMAETRNFRISAQLECALTVVHNNERAGKPAFSKRGGATNSNNERTVNASRGGAEICNERMVFAFLITDTVQFEFPALA